MSYFHLHHRPNHQMYSRVSEPRQVGVRRIILRLEYSHSMPAVFKLESLFLGCVVFPHGTLAMIRLKLSLFFVVLPLWTCPAWYVSKTLADKSCNHSTFASFIIMHADSPMTITTSNASAKSFASLSPSTTYLLVQI